MMAIPYRQEVEMLTLHDPTQEGKLIRRPTEVRYDPLTGETSRILFDSGTPFVPPDYSGQATSGWCPFCDEHVFTSTPRFPDDVAEGGRIVRGEAVLFPNLYPYAKHNAVIRITKQHYVRGGQFTAEQLENAFSIAHAYLKKIVDADPAVKHVSINWNYLPPSGGSILHPHIQAIASEHPTRCQATTQMACDRFLHEHGTDYFRALIEEEKRLGVRWVGQRGEISWVHAFAPRSHMDFIGVLERSASFAELDDSCWKALAESVLRFLTCMREKGLESFNLALFLPLQPSSVRPHIRLVPRLTYGVLGTSDMHVLNFLHGESLSLKRPEQNAGEAAKYFA